MTETTALALLDELLKASSSMECKDSIRERLAVAEILAGRCPGCGCTNHRTAHAEYDQCVDCDLVFPAKEILENDNRRYN